MRLIVARPPGPSSPRAAAIIWGERQQEEPLPIVINGQRVDDAVLNAEFANIKAYFESLGNVSC